MEQFEKTSLRSKFIIPNLHHVCSCSTPTLISLRQNFARARPRCHSGGERSHMYIRGATPKNTLDKIVQLPKLRWTKLYFRVQLQQCCQRYKNHAHAHVKNTRAVQAAMPPHRLCTHARPIHDARFPFACRGYNTARKAPSLLNNTTAHTT